MPVSARVDSLQEDVMKDLVSHQLVKYLKDRGVKHIFGLCGHTNIAVLSALENSAIDFINVRHEQIAAVVKTGKHGQLVRDRRRDVVDAAHDGSVAVSLGCVRPHAPDLA